ncbi:zinc finger CCCH domain-containing protein 46-like isoform X2 [Bidens hawaiensis]|uniref:zinc finger CCCH domain-containing protein 46-like isoform X2 n=1 Tax=Bidens hawaiensis TaxID=980011 RepID=UPI0040494A1C
MDTVEATKMVMSRIQKLDPDNASKIMGYILIQDQGDNEMIRLAFGPENLLVSVIKQAKAFLDISSNTSSATSFAPRNPPHIIIPPSPSSPWSLPGSFSDHHRPPYSAVVSGGGSFYDDYHTNNNNINNNMGNDQNDEVQQQQQQHLHHHRRSCSVNDAYEDDVSGGVGGYKMTSSPCMYYARGFCKNGTGCKFSHGFGDELGLSGSSSCSSPSGKIEAFEDLMRIKAMQQQRIAAMGGGGGGVNHPFHFNRCMNFLNENPRSPTAAMMLGDEFHKFGRCRPDRNDFGPMGFGGSNSSSRQIYLTFPADSTFKEEDVSNYFSMFGPVQDVRIPYQQKRMFGFVTFMLPETVKAILAKGNPHFVCDSRVLVKPYKEKGKIPDKKHLQQMERGDFSGCLSPTALESAEPFDHIPFGARMFNHDMMLRRKLEERELHQAIEFQDRRLMNLQLNDVKNHMFQRSLSLGAAINSPTQLNQNLVFPMDFNNEELVAGGSFEYYLYHIFIFITNNNQSIACDAALNDKSDPIFLPEAKEESSDQNETPKKESFEYALPDNLFASPKKSTTTDQTSFSNDTPEADYSAAIPINVTSKCQAIEM